MSKLAPRTRTITAQCRCKAVHFTITLPASSFPLGVHLCHCSICRYTHGTPCIFHSVLPPEVVPEFVAPSSMASLTGYCHSKAKSERFFCSNCGCHVGDSSIEKENMGQWNVASSIFLEQGKEWFRINTHALTICAPGTGLHIWLPNISGREIKTWNPTAENPSWDTNVVTQKPEYDASGKERLRAECHCGGVSFTIPRPSIAEITNNQNLRNWISPTDPNKWKAVLDVCNDCRLVSGAHVIGWTFSPRVLLDPPMPEDLRDYGTMKVYESSKEILRGFCGVCGATVVFSSPSQVPGDSRAMVDIATGILRAVDGIAAEDWLTWRTSRMSFENAGRQYDSDFTDALGEGLDAWGKARFGDALDFSVG